MTRSSTSTPTPTADAVTVEKSPPRKRRAFTYLRNHVRSPSNPTNPTQRRYSPQISTPPNTATAPSISDPTSTDTSAPEQTAEERSPYEVWLDTVSPSGLLPPSSRAAPEVPEATSSTMAKGRSGSGTNQQNGARKTPDNATSSLQGHPQDQMPTIRLTPHQDPRSNRPSLSFPPTQRTLPHEDCIIRVGRYSERDINPNPPANIPSSAPVGFKSKVVSRRHCEFWCSQGQWYIKDVKSSSGTFLNHIRLSQPSVESRPWPVNDGDVVQLGIDFRGGEEMIFRCVKIRVETNRAWQKTLNNYNVQTHKRLRDLGKTTVKKDSDTASAHSSECSICLMSIAPCQSLFVAPCSHVWHYKCIRPILNDHKTWPQFLCPNCRAVTDLEADVDDPNIEWEDEDIEPPENREMNTTPPVNGTGHEEGGPAVNGDDESLAHSTSRLSTVTDDEHPTPSETASPDVTSGVSNDLLSRRGNRPIPPPISSGNEPSATRATSAQVDYLRPITPTGPFMGLEINGDTLSTPTTDQLVEQGPMTPTNSAGPFVFDGSAGRGALGTAVSTSET